MDRRKGRIRYVIFLICICKNQKKKTLEQPSSRLMQRVACCLIRKSTSKNFIYGRVYFWHLQKYANIYRGDAN